MDVALGNTVYVIDYGADKNVPRALYQGLEFIKYTLSRRWLNTIIDANVRGNDCSKYFEECYRALDKRTLKKLDYFRKFLKAKFIDIVRVSASTDKDGNYEYYKNILWRERCL